MPKLSVAVLLTISSSTFGATLPLRALDETPFRIVIPAPAKRPVPNGYDAFVSAAKMLVTTTYVDDVNDPKPPKTERERARKYSLRNKERWLHQNRAAFDLFQKALRMKTMYPVKPAFDAPFYGFGNLREMARAKTIERNTFVMRGDWNRAMQSRIDTVQMGTDTARGGAIIAGLTGIAIQAIGRYEPWSNVDNLNARQARLATKRLEAIYERRITQAENMGEEKWGTLSQLKDTFKERNWRDISKWTDEKLSLADRAVALTIPKQTIVDNVIAASDAQIANARLPLLKQKTLPLAADPFSRVLVAPYYDKVAKAYARNDAGNALWLVALALRAYKIERKSYPTTLRVLVPRYLKAIPADPFGGGENLRYQRTGKSYVLWSIGADGVDNGGVPVPPTAREKTDPRLRLPVVNIDSKGDFVANKNR